MKIAIFVNTEKPFAEQTGKEAAEILAAGAEVSFVSLEEIAQIDTDLFVVIGGDGTILRLAGTAAERGIPLLGINTGRLGFMASLETSELKLLEKIKAGDYTISNRMRLIGEQRRNGAIINTMTATNEITALRPVSKITDFTVRAGDEGEKADNLLKTVCGFRADGVLVATPTGSTAYALANGGAIIEPNASCMELTPICAHSLSMRPMIFSSDTIITVSCKLPVYDNAGAVQINADGNHIADMKEGDELSIRRSDKPLKLIDLKPNAFYESVNGKLFQSLK